jgi:hypothetical protein
LNPDENRSRDDATIATSQSSDISGSKDSLSRQSPEYWLDRVAAQRQLTAGDEPLVAVSFASEDQTWGDELHAFLEPRLEQLRDADNQAYRLWNFSDVKRGTTPGDEFPEVVAEKMWRCRAAVILLSRDYFRSRYCIELPFLLWRWEHQKMLCLPIKIGTIPVSKVKLPKYEGPFSRRVHPRKSAPFFRQARCSLSL